MLTVGTKNPFVTLDFGPSFDRPPLSEVKKTVAVENSSDEFIWNAAPSKTAEFNGDGGVSLCNVSPNENNRLNCPTKEAEGESKNLSFNNTSPIPKNRLVPDVSGKNSRLITIPLFLLAIAGPLLVPSTAQSPMNGYEVKLSEKAGISLSNNRRFGKFGLRTKVPTPTLPKTIVKLTPSGNHRPKPSDQPIATSLMFEFGGIKRPIGFGYFGPAVRIPQLSVAVTGIEIPALIDKIREPNSGSSDFGSDTMSLRLLKERAGRSVVNPIGPRTTPNLQRVAFSQVLIPNLITLKENDPIQGSGARLRTQFERKIVLNSAIIGPRNSMVNDAPSALRRSKSNTDEALRQYFRQKLLAQNIKLMKPVVNN